MNRYYKHWVNMSVLQQLTARKQVSNFKTMLVFASNSQHYERPVSYKVVVHFPSPTSCTVDLTKGMSGAAVQLLRDGVRYYLIGIGVIDLVSDKRNQLDLFNPPTANPLRMLSFDNINQRYGRDTLFLAAQGVEHNWAMLRDSPTPQYTTSWGCLPNIKC